VHFDRVAEAIAQLNAKAEPQLFTITPPRGFKRARRV
jgi:hypothetical protein